MFLEPLDLAKMYKEHKSRSTYQNKKSDHWDKRSAEMAPRMQGSSYVDEFLSQMDLRGDEVVLDVGCGPGTLAIPLAKRVKKVIAVDFSQSMLDLLSEYATREGVSNIETHLLSWDDSWESLPQVDVVVASRSMEVADLHATLQKLNHHAKKACYVTFKVGGSFVDEQILEFVGKEIVTKPDYWYIPLLLYKMGYLAEVSYLGAEAGSLRYSSEEAFVNSLVWSLDSLSEEQKQKAREFYCSFVECGKFEPKPTVWAMIKWRVERL